MKRNTKRRTKKYKTTSKEIQNDKQRNTNDKQRNTIQQAKISVELVLQVLRKYRETESMESLNMHLFKVQILRVNFEIICCSIHVYVQPFEDKSLGFVWD